MCSKPSVPGNNSTNAPNSARAHDFAEIGLADFRAGRNVAHHLQRRVAAGAAGRKDVHRAIFMHVNLHAGGFDDGLDLLAARSNQVANLVCWNRQFEQARCVRGNRRASFAQASRP